MNNANSAPAKPRRLRRLLIPAAILLAALTIAALLITSKPKAKPVVVEEKAWLVSAEQVTPAPLVPSLTLYGRVESLWSSSLTSGVTADVLEVAVIEGEDVAKGDLLVRLDDRDARLLLAQHRAELQEAEARIAVENSKHAANLQALPRERRLLTLARNEVNRLQGLVKKKVSAQSALDNARQAAERQAIALLTREQTVNEHAARLAEQQAKLARTQAKMEQAELELERCNVRSLFNGRISQVMVAPGKRVRSGDKLLQLYDTDALVIRAQLPNRHISTVRRALRDGKEIAVSGMLDAEKVNASLLTLAGEVSGRTGGVEALFQISKGATTLQQGRFIRIDLQLPELAGLVALPHEAIYGTDKVYVLDAESRMRQQRVERVGEQRLSENETRVLVRSTQLSANSKVITTQLPNAIDGLLIRVAK